MRKVLLVDFDGVVSNGRFYESTLSESADHALFIQKHLFSPENEQLIREWMRGKRSYEEIHEMIRQDLDLPRDVLDRLLVQSVKEFTLNTALLQHIARLRKNDWSVYLYTDNMDIFDRVSVSHFGLDRHFDAIYSSSAYGYLKFENDRLLTILKTEQGITQEPIYLVDDKIHQVALDAGLHFFHYKDWSMQNTFEQWIAG
jgi:FMN phosphatase YigB (HAD superfamily)